MEKRVLFLDTVHPVLQEKLTNDGYICVQDYQCTSEELKKVIHEYFGLVIRSRLILDKEVLSNAKNLNFIARSGSGLENIDLEFADQHKIKCFNSPEGNRDAVGEHTIAMLLSLFNNITQGNEEVKSGIWKREENRGIELGNMTVGIIGYGNTGSAFAKKLSGFDCTVLAYDIIDGKIDGKFAKKASLGEIQKECDVISVHIPYNPENHHFINQALLSGFEKNIYVVNTSRGKIMNTEDLVNSIQSGDVIGACMDVLEYEKHSFDLDDASKPKALKFLQSDNRVLLSPHVAGWTTESYYKLSKVLYQKIKGHFG